LRRLFRKLIDGTRAPPERQFGRNEQAGETMSEMDGF
jgi:hypothetical protein